MCAVVQDRVKGLLSHDYMKEDIYLVRFLRSRNFNTTLAEQRLKANLKWREETNIDNVRLEDFSDISSKYPVYMDTHAKNGAPVVTSASGVWNLVETHRTGKGQRLLRYLEKVMDSFLLRHGCPRCLIGIGYFLNSYENHFPGMIDKLVIVNATPTIQVVGPLARFATRSDFLSHVKLYGNNKEVWENYLQEFIDKDQLPVELGGTHTHNK
ncbi:SEC14-like protein 2 [Orchesella cincta]|uniref:SEC14-like protein 2 n=1 Tax=Orchesella cincta TaxID=48709 RepID=A0A1D2M360_ORCCI|nr:SEC14-like protein 2 [Orchesella cincta]